MAKSKGKKSAAVPDSKPVAAVNGAMNIVRKLSPKTICGTIEKPEKQVHLFTVSGIAQDTKEKETNFGPSTALLGKFLATRADGAEFSAATLYLPEPMNSHIANAVKSAQSQYLAEADGGGKPALPMVQFALRISVKPQADQTRGGRGYEYVTEAIVVPEARGVFDDLRALASGKVMAALAAPTK